MKLIARLLPLLIFVPLLAGCSTPGALLEFDSPQTSADRVPDPAQLVDVGPGSTRLVGDLNDHTLFLGRGENTVCLIYVVDEEIEQVACGGGNGVGSELRGGVMIEVGDFSFPEERMGDRPRDELSESVRVILPD
jgi:hypothetical protein